jgi:hypothetical protein
MIALLRPKKPLDFERTVTLARTEIARQVARGKVDWKSIPELWKRFKDVLLAAQGRKCAFCETRVGSGNWGHVEHFRPKGAVEEMFIICAAGEAHERDVRKVCDTGYWWLAFKWENYLVACDLCNTGWKRSIFHVEAQTKRRKRGLPPAQRRRERQVLLNPYEDDPHPHLEFTAMGHVVGITDRGRITAATCGLYRSSLNIDREAVARSVKRVLGLYAIESDPAKRTILEDELRSKGAPDAIHSAVARATYERAMGSPWPF